MHFMFCMKKKPILLINLNKNYNNRSKTLHHSFTNSLLEFKKLLQTAAILTGCCFKAN